MFSIARGTELTPDIINKMLNRYQEVNIPKIQKWHNYYDGIQPVFARSYEDKTKKCNKIVTNFCKNLVDTYTGYIAAPNCITYQCDDEYADETVKDVFKYNDAATEDSDLLREALISGVSSELMYIDQEKNIRFAPVCALYSFPVFADDMTGDLLYFVRWYKENEWDFDNQVYHIDVYDDKYITHYTSIGLGGSLEFINKELHYFNQCPANVFSIPEEKSIFDCILSLQDAYNETLCNQTDEIAAMANSYLVISGSFDREAFQENLPAMRQSRVLLLDEGCTVNWEVKNVNDNQTNTNLDRIEKNIYRIACCPNFSSNDFLSGVNSGISLKLKMVAWETRASTIEAAMKKALQRRIEIICGFASMMVGEDIFREFKITFQRNLPEDLNSTASALSQLSGLVSDESLLSQLSFIDDPKEEAKKVQEQKLANYDMYSDWNGVTNGEEEKQQMDKN